jgi:hypothetical protein
MTTVELELAAIEAHALATWRTRLTAAEDLLALVGGELAAAQATVDRITPWSTR